MKKLFALFFAIMICFGMVPHLTEAKGFGGSHSFSRHYSTPSHTSTYHSGYRSPSNKVTRVPSSTPYRGSSFGKSLATHAAAFGAGALLGHMFHPFGGYYNGARYGFSFLSILIDIIVILIIVRLVKGIFRRR